VLSNGVSTLAATVAPSNEREATFMLFDCEEADAASEIETTLADTRTNAALQRNDSRRTRLGQLRAFIVGIIMAPVSNSLIFLLFNDRQPTLAFVPAQSENWCKKMGYAVRSAVPLRRYYELEAARKIARRIRCMLACELVEVTHV
jgi:hypothetical protein